jgi:multidrug resistance efflux pump
VRRAVIGVGVVAVLAGAAWAGRRLLATQSTGGTAAATSLPTTRVTRGDLTLTVRMPGDLRAARQAALSAPAVGGALRLLKILDTGTAVAEGDVVVEFDPADQMYALEQAESELQEAEQELIKRRAEIVAADAQEKVGLLTAQFDVRRAELDAQVGADLIGANEHRIRQVSLEENRKKLAQAEQDMASRGVTSKASLAVLQERVNRAKLAAERARQNMDMLVLTAPMAGVVQVADNRDASGGFFFSGMSLPPYRVGDTVNSGRPVLDIFDVSAMEVRARVNEQERANVAPGQAAEITSDGVPDLAQQGVVTVVAGLGRPDRRSGPQRQFDVTLELKSPDPRLRPGTSVTVVARGQTVTGVLLLPRQALFERAGKPIVYIPSADTGRFEAQGVKVIHRTESQVAIEGLQEGTEVALVDPGAVATAPAAPASPAATPAGAVK